MALMDSLANKMLPKKDGFTPQQEFFLGYAQIWCENNTEEAARLRRANQPAFARRIPRERRGSKPAGIR